MRAAGDRDYIGWRGMFLVEDADDKQFDHVFRHAAKVRDWLSSLDMSKPDRTCGFPASGSPTGFTVRHTENS